MRKVVLFLAILVSLSCVCQERLLTKKIVYSLGVTDNVVGSSSNKDTIAYNYVFNKRFFWEAMDALISDLKSKKSYMTTFFGDTIVWDTMFNKLTKALTSYDLKKYSKKDVEKVLENEIRSIKFMEEWTYDLQTMLINKKIIAFCPVVQRDSIALIGDDLKSVVAFSFELGWIWQTAAHQTNDTLLLARNIHYTMNIYNEKPYHWWDNNLEAEYSIPYFDMLIKKADERTILCYETPDAVEPFSLSELEKRKQHSVTTRVVRDLDDDNTITKDTTVLLSYTSDDIDRLRFGEQIIYDKNTHNFYKTVNYVAPIIRIFTSDNIFFGYYPLYYIRKR